MAMKSKSKSMMHIAGARGSSVAGGRGGARTAAGAGRGAVPDRRATTTRALNDRSNTINNRSVASGLYDITLRYYSLVSSLNG